MFFFTIYLENIFNFFTSSTMTGSHWPFLTVYLENTSIFSPPPQWQHQLCSLPSLQWWRKQHFSPPSSKHWCLEIGIRDVVGVWNHWIFVFLKSILICWPHLAHQASCQQIGEVCWRSMLNFHVAVKPAYCKTFEIAPMTFSRHMSCANKRSPLSVSPGVGNQAITEETGDGGCSCPGLRCHPTADDLKTWRET